MLILRTGFRIFLSCSRDKGLWEGIGFLSSYDADCLNL
jgi:hypothetical protein